MGCSPPGSSVHGIPQARILERVAISFSRGSSQPRDQTYISCIAGRFFATEPPGKPGQKIKTLKTLSLRFDSAQRLSSEIQSQMLYSSLGSPCLAGFRENQVAFLVSSCVITWCAAIGRQIKPAWDTGPGQMWRIREEPQVSQRSGCGSREEQ